MLSCTVRAIVTVSGVVARAVAMFFLMVAGAFSVLTPEPLWVRAMSFVVIGLVPAMAAHLIAFLISWTLRRVGRIYDPFAAATWPALWAIIRRALSALHCFSRVAWKRIVMSVTFPIRLVARLLLKLVPTAVRREPRRALGRAASIG
jgi:hypothetical protein